MLSSTSTTGGGGDEDGAAAADEREWLIETTQCLHDLQRAWREGTLQVHASEAELAREVMEISLDPGQLIDRSQLSPKALGLVRTAAMALRVTASQQAASVGQAPIDRAEGQAELFRRFEEVFAAFTGRSYDAFPSGVEVAAAARGRAEREPHAMRRACVGAMGRLATFYGAHATTLQTHARELGGLKLVLGGGRAFGPTAFAGVRRMALYADTQLVADPIFPLLDAKIDHKARHRELLLQLYHLLQLKPLIDARLPVPPVLVFPCFETALEDGDIRTQVGICDLVLQVVSVACGATLTSMEEWGEFIGADPDRFIQAVMQAQLFLPTGVAPGEIRDPRVAVQLYLAEIAKSRKPESVQELAQWPLAAVLANGIGEMFIPQYHLLENAQELTAQPMLTEAAHWHFFEKAANGAAQALQRKDILSADGLKALQALQHARLAWLANVPMPALVELLANQENLAFRKELAEHTKVLSAAGPAELDRAVREVCHAIEAMVQKHEKTIGDIEAKYAPKYNATWLTGGAGVVLGTGAMFLPMLAAFGPAAPLAAGAALLGKLAIDKVHEAAEIRRVRSSLLGVLASTPRR